MIRSLPWSTTGTAQAFALEGAQPAIVGGGSVGRWWIGPFASGNHASDHRVTEHLKADPESVSQDLAAVAEGLAEFALVCAHAPICMDGGCEVRFGGRRR